MSEAYPPNQPHPPQQPHRPNEPYPQSSTNPYAATPPAPHSFPASAPGTAPGMAGPGAFAAYGQRAGAYLADTAIALGLGLVPLVLGTFAAGVASSDRSANIVGSTGALLMYVVVFGFSLWNLVFRQGRTGQSIGKKALGIAVVGERTGQPLGPGTAFVRWFVMWLIGALSCGLGTVVNFLFPLWDPKKQTLHDKAASSIVVRRPAA
ncbi:putative RDD family membrane protein YckC [Knoellia remsis]|uniref:Putative RDD family membrane protein YckC n=1 Tax=Knoellia remsis TaxID=407159 RepID=A0A2T0UJ91_9MICO|nr:RDD family protein [Knoellia remsis]PRY58005.1 putative RDD family membrane protein YckC [Knoellia remsis]